MNESPISKRAQRKIAHRKRLESTARREYPGPTTLKDAREFRKLLLQSITEICSQLDNPTFVEIVLAPMKRDYSEWRSSAETALAIFRIQLKLVNVAIERLNERPQKRPRK